MAHSLLSLDFIFQWCRRQSSPENLGKRKAILHPSTTVLPEAPGPSLFLLIRGGTAGATRRTWLTEPPTDLILTLEPSASRTECPPRRRITRRRNELSSKDAQASCRSNSLASKHTPFTQIPNVIAAILPLYNPCSKPMGSFLSRGPKSQRSAGIARDDVCGSAIRPDL